MTATGRPTKTDNARPEFGADIEAEVDDLWKVFRSERTRPLKWRLRQIDGILELLRDHEDEIIEALRADFGKPAHEAYATDIGGVISDVRFIRKNLPSWVAPRKLRTPLTSQPAKSRIYPEPWGAVLLFPAWNYPIGLTVLPLVGALAAGNTVAIKPAEMAPASSALLARLLPVVLDEDAVKIFEGGPEMATELLRHRWGHIHYTGSSRVGRIVMQAAARHLTPVTLELGGKNPAYVHHDADIEIAAKRIFWGRLFNAGQTCISPDYVLVDRRVEGKLTDAMMRWAESAYGTDPRESPDYARMVNDRQFERVVGLLKESDGEILYGGGYDADERYIAPTLIKGVSADRDLMTQETFGPILTIVPVDGPDAAVREINTRPQPLCLYVFTGDDRVAEQFIAHTSSGSVVVNQMFTQAFNRVLPFGGVGESGMGVYTGKYTFECFSHLKPVEKNSPRPDLPIMYPPYTPWKERVLRLVLDPGRSAHDTMWKIRRKS